MGRRSALTDKQWELIAERYLRGESARALAREFGTSESTIRTRLSAQTAQIKSVANQLLEAESAFKSLPISAQVSAKSFIDDLRAVSMHLAGAAKFGSMTAHRLAGIANQHAQLIDDDEPDEEKLRRVAQLQSVANEATKTGLNLLASNKDEAREANRNAPASEKPRPTTNVRALIAKAKNATAG